MFAKVAQLGEPARSDNEYFRGRIATFLNVIGKLDPAKHPGAIEPPISVLEHPAAARCRHLRERAPLLLKLSRPSSRC